MLTSICSGSVSEMERRQPQAVAGGPEIVHIFKRTISAVGHISGRVDESNGGHRLLNEEGADYSGGNLRSRGLIDHTHRRGRFVLVRQQYCVPRRRIAVEKSTKGAIPPWIYIILSLTNSPRRNQILPRSSISEYGECGADGASPE
eukprot:SAG11_NODE_2025_length_3908_cov_1.787346_6_plen_146_part_00